MILSGNVVVMASPRHNPHTVGQKNKNTQKQIICHQVAILSDLQVTLKSDCGDLKLDQIEDSEED